MTILEAVTTLFNRIVDPRFTVRRMNVVANNVIPEGSIPKEECEQLSLFSYKEDIKKEQEQAEWKDKEHRMQKAVVEIKKRYGKGAMLKGMNLEEGATTILRNGQVGGHKA